MATAGSSSWVAQPAYARGAWAVLSTFALFQVVSFVEALLGAAANFSIGGGSTVTFVAAHGGVMLVGLAARAALLLRALRLPTTDRLGPLPIWQPIVLTIVAIVAALAAQAARTTQTALFARTLGAEALGHLSLAVGVVATLANLAEQVLLVLALWIAFVRGRDVQAP